MTETDLPLNEDLRDELAFAINGAWNAQGDVPFPLYQHEAEALADAAMEVLRARASLSRLSPPNEVKHG